MRLSIPRIHVLISEAEYHQCGKELSIRFTVHVLRGRLSICECSPYPFFNLGVECET